ncbi:hypothetical protein J4233_01360 [Candidatus Pacearchaeota archaeon]|nr:hypothetical protein [Candidatus Pacearchaeota archaeon]
MEAIIKEKISADHLLYVSLKYTKTCDVIINLLSRWKNMIEQGMDRLVAKAKKDKKWKPIPDAPRAKLIQLKSIFRENEFRKGVNLKVTYRDKIVNINLNQLKEYAATLERFISYIK